MTELFKLGSTDLTVRLNTRSYVMNKEPVFESWTDGNSIEHRVKTRDRITGTVAIEFNNATDLSTFMTLLSSSITADGYYSVTAYVVNTDTTETINAFLDMTATAEWDFVNSRQRHVLTITVTQR